MPAKKTRRRRITGTGQLVPSKYYDVFGLRVKGLSYSQIAQRTGFSEGWIKTLFAKGGQLYDFWRAWVEEYKGQALEEAMDMEFGNLPDLVRANITAAMNTKTSVGVQSRKLIFDRIFGLPSQTVKMQGAIGVMSFADWVRQTSLEEDDENDEGDEVEQETIIDV